MVLLFGLLLGEGIICQPFVQHMSLIFSHLFISRAASKLILSIFFYDGIIEDLRVNYSRLKWSGFDRLYSLRWRWVLEYDLYLSSET